jgi:hypothetical protein
MCKTTTTPHTACSQRHTAAVAHACNTHLAYQCNRYTAWQTSFVSAYPSSRAEITMTATCLS